MKERMKYVKYTLKHKLAILLLWSTKNTKVRLRRVLLHDIDKVILYPILGKEITSKFHKKYIKHHNVNIKDKANLYERYLDYASARLTKPDKPLDAIETVEKYFPDELDAFMEIYEVVKYK